jgi:putative ABC transport system substrate-binding protein
VLRRAALALGLIPILLAHGIALAADVRARGHVARIGILSAASQSLMAQFRVFDPFLQQLHDLGYVEGRNFVFEYRLAEGKPERLPGLAAELVRLNVDVILASGPAAARAARDVTATIPIVFTLVDDAVAEGLVASLGRPERNVTGVSLAGGVEIAGKRLQLLREAVPSVKSVGILWNPGNPSHAALVREMPRVAKAAGVELHLFEVRRPEDFATFFASISNTRIDGLVVLGDVILALRSQELTDFLGQHRIPTIYGDTEFVKVGGLMAYQTSFATVMRRAAIYVDKILKGAKPSDLPVEEPREIELVINLRTAKAMGLALPQSLMLRADRVIE